MKTRMKLAMSVLLVALLAGVAIATVYQTRIISNTVFIQGDWDFQIYTENTCANVWTSQNWGTLARSASVESGNRFGKNSNNDPIYVKWSAFVPTGFTLTAKWGPEGTLPANMNPLAQNVYIGPFPKKTSGYSWIMIFTLTATSDAPAGTSTFDITFTGSDTNS